MSTQLQAEELNFRTPILLLSISFGKEDYFIKIDIPSSNPLGRKRGGGGVWIGFFEI